MDQLIANNVFVGFDASFIDPIPSLVDPSVMAFFHGSIGDDQAQAWVHLFDHRNGFANDL